MGEAKLQDLAAKESTESHLDLEKFAGRSHIFVQDLFGINIPISLTPRAAGGRYADFGEVSDIRRGFLQNPYYVVLFLKRPKTLNPPRGCCLKALLPMAPQVRTIRRVPASWIDAIRAWLVEAAHRRLGAAHRLATRTWLRDPLARY